MIFASSIASEIPIERLKYANDLKIISIFQTDSVSHILRRYLNTTLSVKWAWIGKQLTVGNKNFCSDLITGPALIAVFFLKTEAAILHKYVCIIITCRGPNTRESPFLVDTHKKKTI